MTRSVFYLLVICTLVLICVYQISNWTHMHSDQECKEDNVSSENPYTKYDINTYLKSPFPYKRLRNTDKKYPQAKQDETLYELFPKKNGFFIEMGAFDGITFSNTLWLERNYNWSGLLIEANPDLCRAIDNAQRRVWRLCACISEMSDTVFIQQGTLGRAVDTLEDVYLNRDSTIRVPCFKLDRILEVLQNNHVDYFSLDVEGGEMSVLNSIKKELALRTITVDVWTIEYRVIYKDQEIVVDKSKHNLKLLRKYFREIGGYAEHSQLPNTPFTADSMGKDVIFVNVAEWCKHHSKIPSGAKC